MLALADRADDTGFAWPSVEDICERTKLSPRAVQKAVAKLVEIGELDVEGGGGRRVRNRYRVTPKPRTSDGVTDEKPGTSDGVTDGKPRTSDGVSPEETPSFATETPSFATETPSFEHGNPVNSAGEPPLEPPTEPSGNHHSNPASHEDRLPAVRSAGEVDSPDWMAPLQDAMSGAGINVPWKLIGDDAIRLHNDIKRLGIPLMVEQALKAAQGANRPPFSSRWFYDSWHAIRTPVAIGNGPSNGSNVVPLAAGRRPSTTDQRVNDALALAAEFRALEEGTNQ
jgi:hypothetical protein